MKLPLLIILLTPLLSFSQSPFKRPNTPQFHYFTSADIDSLELHDIYEVEKTGDTGGMGENVDLMHYYLSPSDGYYSSNWHGFYDSSDAKPVIDTLIQFMEETFINGVEWQFDTTGLSMSGGHGYGSLSMSYFEHLDTVTVVNRMTRHSPTEELGFITYNSNGLPKQFIGWAVIDMYEEDPNGDYEEFNLDFFSNAPDLDTTLYTYDEDLKLTSIKDLRTGEERFTLFTPLDPQELEIFHQCYIGSEVFETRIQELTGSLPSTVLFEISPFHAFVFKLDSPSGHYRFTEIYELI